MLSRQSRVLQGRSIYRVADCVCWVASPEIPLRREAEASDVIVCSARAPPWRLAAPRKGGTVPAGANGALPLDLATLRRRASCAGLLFSTSYVRRHVECWGCMQSSPFEVASVVLYNTSKHLQREILHVSCLISTQSIAQALILRSLAHPPPELQGAREPGTRAPPRRQGQATSDAAASPQSSLLTRNYSLHQSRACDFP